MAALAAADDRGALGCTQVTEIVNTRGVTLVGPLPKGHELATEYRAAVTVDAVSPALAAALVGELGGPETASLRSARGFISIAAGADRHTP
jgi:molybdate transport system substrate-binding protein